MDNQMYNNQQGTPMQGMPYGMPQQPYGGIPGQGMPQEMYMQGFPAPKVTEETKRMKGNFGFFGVGTFVYAVFYAFCMYRNGSGVTFPLFMGASLIYLSFALSKLGLKLKKGSAFNMISIMLLAVSTFCTDDLRIIAFNKTGIFLLVMSLMISQFCNTEKWSLGKYLGSIIIAIFASIGELLEPFTDAVGYFKQEKVKKNKNAWYVFLGALIAIPLVVFVLIMLSTADVVFKQLTDVCVSGISIEGMFEVAVRIGFMFFATYWIISYLCRRTIDENVKDNRKGEPILAITITGILTVIYVLFSGIQIVYLFMGQMELPEGYTYAMYAREGFFQLLAVSAMNLVIVLIAISYFKESRILKGILTVMSLCTFIMIASSALRMIIYIRFYYLTFLRILVLWALALLFVLFVGVIISIFKKNFPLFRYSMVMVTVLYMILSFSHPDYIIARVNIANVNEVDEFFLTEEKYEDYDYLAWLSADAAPVMIPYLEQLGYDLDMFYDEEKSIIDSFNEGRGWGYREPDSSDKDQFGYYYLEQLKESTKDFGIRTYNVSRHTALRYMKNATK